VAHAIEKKALKYVDFFWVLNYEELEILSSLVGKDKVKMQPGVGVDFDKFKPISKERARRKLDLPLNAKILLSVCSLSKRKGIDYVLRALPSIVGKYQNFLYLLVGDERPDGEEFRKLVDKLGLDKYVRFFGRVDEETLINCYNAADVFILPSLQEGLGTVLAEAMACGTPVIGTKVGGIPIVINNFKSGLLIPPKSVKSIEQAIIQAFDLGIRPPDREEGAKYHSWRFIIENVCRKYDELFRKYYEWGK